MTPVSHAGRSSVEIAEAPNILGTGTDQRRGDSLTPLVSILIPAYNAEQWICETLQSVVRQTWRRKEVIVVDDGSTDRTLSIARQFASPSVKVISQENRGGGIARNTALSLAQGDYVQYLDHDDLLAPDKVARQVEAMSGGDDERTLLSGSFSKFFYCVQRAKPVRNVMCQDLHPVEFFIHKLNDEAAWLQIGAYLFSRRLIEMAGPWYEKQSTDDDGNYVDRVVMSCERIHFVSEARSYWRIGNTRSAGHRNTKQMHEAAFHTTVHSVQQLLSLENSDRTRAAGLRFLRLRSERYFMGEPEMLARLETLAESLGGTLVFRGGSDGATHARDSRGLLWSAIVNRLLYPSNMLVKRNLDRYFWKNLYLVRSGISGLKVE